jgi:endonuclease-3 related protein
MDMKTETIREELLSINGIGPETADSIILYGLRRKIFVVDAYTKRIFSRLGIININQGYEEVRNIFQKGTSGGAVKYNEYHALIVGMARMFVKTNLYAEPAASAAYALHQKL